MSEETQDATQAPEAAGEGAQPQDALGALRWTSDEAEEIQPTEPEAAAEVEGAEEPEGDAEPEEEDEEQPETDEQEETPEAKAAEERLSKAYSALAKRERTLLDRERTLKQEEELLGVVRDFAKAPTLEGWAKFLASANIKPEVLKGLAKGKPGAGDPTTAAKMAELERQVRELKEERQREQATSSTQAFRNQIIDALSGDDYPLLGADVHESQERVYDLIAQHADDFAARHGRDPRRNELLSIKEAARMLEEQEAARFEKLRNRLTSNQKSETVDSSSAPARPPKTSGASSKSTTPNRNARATLSNADSDAERVDPANLDDEARQKLALSQLKWAS